MTRGRLVAFEGGEACGKSTQAARLATAIGALLTHEPGATALGARVRDLLLDPAGAAVDARTEALLMAADRAQHVADVVRPALEAGRDVVTDRFSHSSLAYQGYGRGLPLDEVRRLSAWATGNLWPDLVVLLDVSEEVRSARLAAAGAPDRMEAESPEFHERVLGGFRALAASDPERWRVVEADGSVEEVATRVHALFDEWSAR